MSIKTSSSNLYQKFVFYWQRIGIHFIGGSTYQDPYLKSNSDSKAIIISYYILYKNL